MKKRKCRYWVVVRYPEEIWHDKAKREELLRFILEDLAQYFGIDCISHYPLRKLKTIQVYMNKSLMATASNIRALKAKFWSAWRVAKKHGVRLYP